MTLWMLEKNVSMNICSMNEIQMYYIRHCHCHVTYSATVIHISSPVASWDSKASIRCVFQNLRGNVQVLFAYSFMSTVNSDIGYYSFHSREVGILETQSDFLRQSMFISFEAHYVLVYSQLATLEWTRNTNDLITMTWVILFAGVCH